MLYATCKKTHVEISDNTNGFYGKMYDKESCIQVGEDILNTYGEDYTLMCSSSIDFPEETTSNPNVIKICDMIRNS